MAGRGHATPLRRILPSFVSTLRGQNKRLADLRQLQRARTDAARDIAFAANRRATSLLRSVPPGARPLVSSGDVADGSNSANRGGTVDQEEVDKFGAIGDG
jgi:hypothetical protein